MPDTRVEIDLKRGEDPTREGLEGLLKYYSHEDAWVFVHTPIEIRTKISLICESILVCPPSSKPQKTGRRKW